MKPLKSDSTSLLGISGDCILALTPQRQLVCALRSTNQLVGVWPFNCFRTYWGGKERFGFVAGRRSPRGEGEFTFLTEEGEVIYRRLKRAIELTSFVTKSRVDESLPPDPTREETPVPFDDSDEELPNMSNSPPPVPDKPLELLKRLSMGNLPPTPVHQPPVPGSMSTDEISETGPAYFTNQGSKHLLQQETSSQNPPKVIRPSPRNPAAAAAVKQPLEATRSSPIVSRPPPLEDDTYSHTAHDIPLSFIGRRSPMKTAGAATAEDKEKIYHGLVRTESTKSSVVSPARAPPNLPTTEPLPEGDITYDVAFPADSCAEQQLPMLDGEYGSMGDAEEQKKILREKKAVEERCRLLSRDNVTFGAQLRGRVESSTNENKRDFTAEFQDDALRDRSDTMTSNPIYGSHDPMLGNHINVEGSMSIIRYGQQDRYHEASNPLTDSMVANPVYGEHMAPRIPGPESRGMVYDDRPVSPLEHSLVSNPLYGSSRSTNPLQVGTVRMENESQFASDIDGCSNQASEHNGENSGTNTNDSDTQGGNDGNNCNGNDSSEGVSSEEQTDSTEFVTTTQNSGPVSTQANGMSTQECPSTDQQSLSHTGDNHEPNVPSIEVKSEEPSSSVASTFSTAGTPIHAHSSTEQVSMSASAVADSSVRTSPAPARVETPVHGPHTPEKGFSPAPGSDQGASPIHRDGRGYSKVDKTRKAAEADNEENQEGNSVSPPPPVPPRKYSDSDS